MKNRKLKTALFTVIIICTALTGCGSQKEKSQDGATAAETASQEDKTNIRLIFSDEFDKDGLPDSSKWTYDVGGTGWGNNELQYYTNARLKNAEVSDGSLKINAIKEDYQGMRYTSTRLVSKASLLYGRVEVKAKLPNGGGTWPAIWMLPDDYVYGGWPNSGEIDIMEHVGNSMNVVHGSTHSLKYYFKIGTQKTATIVVPKVDTEFHVYAMEWTPKKIEVFVDDKKYFISTFNEAKDSVDGWKAWPFDQKFHILLNIAVGGGMGGKVDDSDFPQQMIVDYVRMYDMGIVKSDLEKPSAPQNIKVKPAATLAPLTWDCSSDNTGIKFYEVYNGDKLSGTTASNSFTVKKLTPETKYSFKIRAVDHNGNKSEFALINVDTTKLTATAVPAKIEAENYIDSKGVDVEECADEGGTKNVGWIDSGDWMDFMVDVKKGGEYTVLYRVAGESLKGTIELLSNDKSLGTVDVLPTGGWQKWTTVTQVVELQAGVQTLRINAKSGGFNVNYIEVKD